MKCTFEEDGLVCGELETHSIHQCYGKCSGSPKLLCHPFQWSNDTTHHTDPPTVTRLEKLLTNIRHPEDVAFLKSKISALRSLPDIIVQTLYSDWSELYYCASWLILGTVDIEEFRDYLDEVL